MIDIYFLLIVKIDVVSLYFMNQLFNNEQLFNLPEIFITIIYLSLFSFLTLLLSIKTMSLNNQ